MIVPVFVDTHRVSGIRYQGIKYQGIRYQGIYQGILI